MNAIVIDWDGQELRPDLKQLPPGRYILEPMDDLSMLSSEEEEGIIAALEELDSGGGLPLDEVVARIRARFSRCG